MEFKQINRAKVVLLGAAILFAALCPATASTPAFLFDPELAAKEDPLFDLATFKKLNGLMLSVDWTNADIQVVLDELSEKAVKLI